MKRLFFIGLLGSILAISITSCSMSKGGTGAVIGGTTGAVAGNLLTGGSAVGTAVGAAGGAVGGYYLGKN